MSKSDMGYRFFAATPITSDRTTLTGTEAHHLQHVLRATVGDEITLFDGTGKEFSGRIERIKRSEVEVVLTGSHAVSREPVRETVVGLALPKGNRQRWVIEKLTELGVTRVVPLRSARSVAHPDRSALKKFQRFIVESCKQCGRNHLMDVSQLTTFEDFLRAAPDSAVKRIADFEGEPAGGGYDERSVYLAIGPEGGFTREECRDAEAAGWRPVSLGPRILRVETAAVVLATLASSDLHGNQTAFG
ncbi:MAG: 16S rRNA (uracil(1498)-N(3))-methyltransferase [Planctomycetota bacterium]